MKTCIECKISYSLDKFYIYNRKFKSGNMGLKIDGRCKKCFQTKHKLEYSHYKRKSETLKPYYSRKKVGLNTNDPFWTSISILDCARRSDKRNGLQCDLTLEFIRDNVGSPCVYCGESKNRRSLDRVDNSIGHLKSNVVVACVRCNLMRSTMPYIAWLEVAKEIRIVQESGGFGDWEGIFKCGVRKQKPIQIQNPLEVTP